MKAKHGIVTAAMLVAVGAAWTGAGGTATTQNESATPSVTLTGEAAGAARRDRADRHPQLAQLLVVLR
ncbi:hypothetical protein [Streptomyces sp. NPDC018711]|uniref:hypothetical protein n=1 Tax=Streptomyces sp. NPDC018711 TaxID=3365052 RepID=UPI0037B2046A